MAMINLSMDEMDRRGIGGVCDVEMYDGSMSYAVTTTIIGWVSKAVANSIARHYNRITSEIGIDISYYVVNRDRMEPDLSHWQ